jgi:arsenite methyltransferase
MKERGRDPGAIRAAVRQRYAGLVTADRARCPAPAGAHGTPQELMEGKLVKLAGYAGDLLERLPAGAVAGSYGCGDPLALADVEEGQTVLDIGSGAGMDCLIASRRVGPGGRVIGIDMTAEMLERARENARAAGCTNVEFRHGVAEAIPVEDEAVDWVISNCAINLSPEKPLVFAEIARVLKPGGRFSISDIVIADALPSGIAESVDAWTGCVAGAITPRRPS